MQLFLVTNLIALALFHGNVDHIKNKEENCNQEVIISSAILNYVASRDFPEIVDIISENYKWLGYCDAQHVIKSMQLRTDDQPDHEVFKVLRVENKAVGLIIYESDPVQKSTKISCLAVHKDFCNKGYASQLLQYAIDDTRSHAISNINLGCHRENKKALSLYRKKFNFGITNTSTTWLHLSLELSER